MTTLAPHSYVLSPFGTRSHIADDKTGKTLCGRDAKGWQTTAGFIPALEMTESVSCLVCLAAYRLRIIASNKETHEPK